MLQGGQHCALCRGDKMGSEIPGVQPAPWAQSHEEVWVATDPGGWWGETHTSHATGNPLWPLPPSCPVGLSPLPTSLPRGRTRLIPPPMTCPWQFLSTSGHHRLCLPGRLQRGKRTGWAPGQPGCGDGKGGYPQARVSGAGRHGAGGRDGGLRAFPQMPIDPSPFPASGHLFLATVLPGTPVFRES